MHHRNITPFRFPSFLAAVCLFAAVLCGLPSSGRAQLLGAITEGPASAPYKYYLTVEFGNGHYYDFTLRTTVASFTGTDFINTVAAGSQGTALVLNVGQVASAYGNYINSMSVNSDSNSGFANNSYWTYWTGSASNPVMWTYSQVGEDSRTITPGLADGWVYSDGTHAPQATTFPVPEPSTWALAGVGIVAGAAWSLRRKARA